jgi:uncharacterized protein YjbI with pentapeptide repeats
VGDRNEAPRRFRAAACASSALAILTAALALAAAPPALARAGEPLVRVDDAKLARHQQRAVVTARITWNRPAIAHDDMIVGDVRLVAVGADDDRPTLLASSSSMSLPSDPVEKVRFELSTPSELAAIEPGNRVVLTPSQHAYSPSPHLTTPKTYVTVTQLQAGAPRSVGLRDCADRPIVADADLARCDLVGASLGRAQVGRDGTRTELQQADLTGADLRDADLSDADLAAARVNGANATGATIARVSFAKAEGIGFVAHDTTFDSANIFDAQMRQANFADSTFKGTSLSRSRFDGADFEGATIRGAVMDVARFVGADLRRATIDGGRLYFVDLTDATLRDAVIDASPAALMWTFLCGTELPDGTTSDRDCPEPPTPRPAAAHPFVTVDAELSRGPDRATIEGSVHWNADGVDEFGMRVGEVRAVAVDADGGVPTILGEASHPVPEGGGSNRINFVITDPKALEALADGNRVVVTATQRPPHPEPPEAGDELTERSYVTVDQLQAGPGRGRVGSVDCSDRPIAPTADPTALRFCDLVGASLGDADLAGADLRMADLTGSDLRGAGLASTLLDGSHLGGVPASGARLDSASLIDVSAPRLEIRSTLISGATFFASVLDRASFDGSTIATTSFATSALGRRASFAGAELRRTDLGFAGLDRGDLSGVEATKTSLFLADLTDATLLDSSWGEDEEGRDPPRSAMLCRTTLENGHISDRDCPR